MPFLLLLVAACVSLSGLLVVVAVLVVVAEVGDNAGCSFYRRERRG